MNNHKLTVKDSSLSFLFGFILCQLGVAVVTVIGSLIVKLSGFNLASFLSFLNTGLGYAILSVVLYFIMLCIFLFFNRRKDNQITTKLSIKKLVLYILIAIVSFLTLYPIITCVDTLLIKCGIKINTLAYPLTTKNYFISLISLVIAPAICEELLFRGIIFKGLKKHGKIFSIVISALMFSIYHMSIDQTLYPLLIGLLLAVIMYYENNISYCIAIHLTNNFLSLTLSYFKINLVFNHWTYILLAIILAIVFLIVILSFTIRENSTSEKRDIASTHKIYLLFSLIIMILIWIFANFNQ